MSVFHRFVVAFAAAPEDVARRRRVPWSLPAPSSPARRRRRRRRQLRARRRAVHVAAVAEQVGRAPEQLDAGALLLFLEHLDDRVEVACSSRRGSRLRGRRRGRGRQ